MADSDPRTIIERLREGVRPEGGLRLSGADLAGEDLSGLDLSGADLSGADLVGADLSGAILVGASMREALLDHADLTGADLTGADLEGASLNEAKARGAAFGMANLTGVKAFSSDLSEAVLTKACLKGADLRCATLQGARLREADLRGAELVEADARRADLSLSRVGGANLTNADLRAARLRALQGYDKAIWIGTDLRDINFAGAYLLRRFVMDQNYLKEFRERSRLHLYIYYVWWATSRCGQSMGLWCLWISGAIVFFAFLYALIGVDPGDHPTLLTPLYYSVVTITTLGYGDVVPQNTAGQVLAMLEVMVGYLMLGGLLSILANKMARRAE